ncbi:thioesterase-like superfamily-domain-containing protein [Rhexocercosporidium sp. MPI-PUGE-AT-0058]|nr:thioesterase-like superfamily-domain-containing protein [Rhexocercosporidium sp. MPI-PUGE-AT-0058]
MSMPKNSPNRLPFTELMSLIPLPPSPETENVHGERGEERFMSIRPSYNPGQGSAYGGHVFAQSVWAASFTVGEGMVVHNVHGFFPLPGLVDRPYIYSITHLSEGRSYCTRQVTVRQPLSPSKSTSKSSYSSSDPVLKFSIEDVQGELGKICFSSMISFKRDEEYVKGHQIGVGVRERYGSIVEGKRPESWPLVPRVDAPWANRATARYPTPNTFPGLTLHRVDMSPFNTTLPPTSYRQLTYYTPLGSLPLSSPNLHACAHLYASDRNSLYLIPNALNTAEEIRQMGSLSHSVVFHVSSQELLMREGEWCVQEAWTPRSGSGRGIHESWIWKLEDGEEEGGKGRDVHIASSWQEGVVRYSEKREEQKQRLLWFEGMRKMGMVGEDVCVEEGLPPLSDGKERPRGKL